LAGTPPLWQSVDVPAVQQRFWPDAQPLVERLGRSFFRDLPECPGVYLMQGSGEVVLYVGKAKSLRRRLGSYRVANPDRMPRRILRLLRCVHRITWEECPDESSALRRESELLRALKPRFNRAGVWPGQPRYLIWRAHDRGLDLAVATEAVADWHCAGPFGGQAGPLLRTLVRLLWCRFQPERGISGMPAGWFSGSAGTALTIPPTAPGQAEEAVVQLNQLFQTGADVWQTWLVPPSSGFDRTCWQEDVEWLAEAVDSGQ
jgi:predicted GIY-YIG superfamily endonuclease